VRAEGGDDEHLPRQGLRDLDVFVDQRSGGSSHRVLLTVFDVKARD